MPQWGKNLPGMQETQVQSLGQENPLEEQMANVSDVVKNQDIQYLWNKGEEQLEELLVYFWD